MKRGANTRADEHETHLRPTAPGERLIAKSTSVEEIGDKSGGSASKAMSGGVAGKSG
jgi:hypothetical protein